ncbi:cytochrome b [uncultured Paraglaciecola sp.]|uniref:cytochrome b n=1 Tax=uncultured Paraglaciecola sp. TaxID=1765024 RepID=UPI0030DCD210|tara:strand:+ start:150232 stop:150798 length:567 start_codon:yes stop_codon:yes gene_type:complete
MLRPIHNNQQRYATLSIVMHWVMFLLLVAVYSCIELRELYPKGSVPRETLKTWHFMLGLTVFTLVWIRLIARWFSPTPEITPAIPRWQHFSSKVMHLALYLLMIAMPIAGWLILSGEGKTIPFWGLNLPSLITENKPLAETIEEVHKTAGTVGYYLIGIHMLAGMFHHYVQRDNTLTRMLPKFLSKTD